MGISERVGGLIASMTMQEKVGQLFMAVNAPCWPDSPNVERLVSDHFCGSVISCGYRTLDVPGVIQHNERLQRLARATRPHPPRTACCLILH